MGRRTILTRHPFGDAGMEYCATCGLPRHHPRHTCQLCEGAGYVWRHPAAAAGAGVTLKPSTIGAGRHPSGWESVPCPECKPAGPEPAAGLFDP